MKAKERLQNTRFRNRIMNIIFCTMPLRTSSIVKHDCGTAVAVFSVRHLVDAEAQLLNTTAGPRWQLF